MKFLLPVGGQVEGYGFITAPNHKGVPLQIKKGALWAADVGCLQGPSFVKKADLTRVMEWLEEDMKPYKDKCLFVAGLDIVGKSVETLEAYEEFSRYFLTKDWPYAYVAQNGSENLPIPEDCSTVFIGGVLMDRYYRQAKGYDGVLHQMDWKESPEAVTVIKRAQAMGKHIHIGRVNWERKYTLFNLLKGSENFTCDGTRNKHDGVEKTIREWARLEKQRPLIKI